MDKIVQSRIIKRLEKIYEPVGNEWVKKNSLVMNYAKRAGLTFGGSIGMALSRNKAFKVPGDLDFFTDDYRISQSFIEMLTGFLSQRTNSFYKLMYNHKSKFTLENVDHHVRIEVPFWHKICVMTLNKPLRKFYVNGMAVQYFDDVVSAAKHVTEIDGKERVYEDLFREDYNNDFLFLDDFSDGIMDSKRIYS